MERRYPGGRIRLAALVAALVVLGSGGNALAAPGDLDATFSGDGIAAVRIGKSAVAQSVAMGPEGRVVAAGEVGIHNPHTGVLQLNDDGTRDVTFDGDGRLEIEGLADVWAVEVQPDRAIVLAVRYPFLLVRLLPNGDLDPAFGGGDGIADLGVQGYVSGMALQSDGKFVVAGQKNLSEKFTLVRTLGDGSLDPDFGNGGVANIAPAGASEIQESGDVSVSPTGGMAVVGLVTAGGQSATAVAQLTEDGHADPAFGGGDGVVIHDAGAGERLLNLITQPSGKLVATGHAEGPSNTSDLTLMRLRSSGRLDPNFGGNGIVQRSTPASYDRGLGATVEPDGQIVVVGQATDDVLVARFGKNGQEDTAFGAGGQVRLDLGGSSQKAFDATVDGDGRILVAGTAILGGLFRFVVIRIDGS